MKFYKNTQNQKLNRIEFKKKIKLSILFLLISLLLQAESFTVNGITYTPIASSTNVEVTSACMEIINIPEIVTNAGNSYTVTHIGQSAFLSCNEVIEVSLPDSIIALGNQAFFECNNLININIPNSVTNLGFELFRGCTSLVSISIPNLVTSIGGSVFRDCTSLVSVDLPNTIISLQSGLFLNCSALQTINLPESLESIGPLTFLNCSSLTVITIPETVTNFGITAFFNCSNLTTINIPDGVMTIPDNIFSGCSSLPSITLPETITSIGNGAFNGAQALTSINIPESVNFIGENAFGQCDSLTSLEVNWDVPLTINEDVFFQTAIENITLNVPMGSVSTYEAAPVWMDFNPITDNSTLSTTNLETKNTIRLFPNPTADSVSITNLKTAENYIIYDLFGKKVDSGQLMQGSAIQVSNLEKGIYFLKLEHYKTLRFIKN